MDMEISVFVICIKAITYLLFIKLHDYTFNLPEVLNCPPYRDFLLTTLFLALLHCLVSQGLKEYRFLKMFAKFLVKRLPIVFLVEVPNWSLIRSFQSNSIDV